MEETYQLIEGSPTLRDLDAENGFLWCPFGCIERQNDPGILISRLDDGSYDVRLGIIKHIKTEDYYDKTSYKNR